MHISGIPIDASGGAASSFCKGTRRKSLAAERPGCALRIRMTDYFAILDQPRRPWLEPDAVKAAFHRASAILHPDVPESGDAARFAELNAAHSTLREPASRLRHLLELTAPETLATAAAPPGEFGDLFMQIAGARQRLDGFLKRRQKATSALARALLTGEEAGLRQELEAVLGSLEGAESAVLEEVQEMDREWSGNSSVEALASFYRRLSYLARWLAQTREAVFTLGG